jgi:uncharacterized protein YlxW (UPF0749 family)
MSLKVQKILKGVNSMIHGNSSVQKPVLSGIEGLACIVLAHIIFIAGCAGSVPDLKSRFRPDDEKKSCKELLTEIKSIEKTIAEKQQKIREYEAELSKYRQLDTRLKVIYADKNCSAAAAVEKAKEKRGEK